MVYEVLGLLIIRGLKKSYSPELSFFIAALMMYNSGSINYMVDFARPDIYLVILTIIAMILIRNNKCVILVPFLCIIGMLIHEGFIVIFVPVIATYLLFTYCKKKENIYIISFVLLVICSICSFIFPCINVRITKSTFCEVCDKPFNPILRYKIVNDVE